MKIRRFKDWKIRTKLMTITVLLVMTPLLLAAYLTVTRFNQSLKQSAQSELIHIVNGLYRLAQAQEEIITQKVDRDLAVAHTVLKQLGPGIQERPDEFIDLEIRDQDKSQTEQTIKVPIWQIGETRITGDNRFVDQVQELVNVTCTIFKVIDNDRLLRISTNALDQNGRRAVGTYLPSTSEITRRILAGKPFRGRSFAADNWYITAYDPLFDDRGRVIGSLAVGVKGSESSTLKNVINNTRIGLTGYPYIMDSSGMLIFHPLKQGQNIYDQQDFNGNHFIRQMCQNAKELGEDEFGAIRYPWTNQGETKPQPKIVKYRYLADLDWIIAAGSYESEIFGAIAETKRNIYLVAAVSLILVLIMSIMLSSAISKPILALTEVTARMAYGEMDQCVRVDRLDEIGELGKSFNRMAEQVRSNTVSLEHTVEQRTRELAESRERYRETSHMLNNILQASTEYAIVALNPSGTVFEYNTGARNLFGWTDREILGGSNWSKTYPDNEDSEKSLTDWLRSRLAVSGISDYEVNRRRKNGEVFPAHSTITLIQNPDGQELGFLEISRDITQRNKLQGELQETRDYLKSIVESSVDVIITADTSGKINFLNPAVETVLGYKPEELLGTHISRLYVRGIDQAWDLMGELACHGVTRNYEMPLFAKDGTVIPIMTSAGFLRDNLGRVIGTVGVFTDISERKKLEADLQEAQQSLVQAVKLKAIGDLVAGVAHEINNPLMAAGAILHVLLQQSDNFDQETIGRLGLLRKVNARIAEIVNHLRDFSRQTEIQLESVSINEPIRNAILITRQQLLNSRIELTTELTEDLPRIKGDPNQLEQVFLNLIANARDAMETLNQKRKLTIRTFLDESQSWPRLVAEFTDTGGGIPESQISKIFDPFFSTKEVGKGTGLGLSICYGIIEAHSGTIEVKSTYGQGTTFSVIIPMLNPENA